MNEIKTLGKKIDIDNLKKDHKKFIKINQLILKTQQRFKSERNNFSLNKLKRFN